MKIQKLYYFTLIVLFAAAALGQRDPRCRPVLDGGRCPTVTRYRYDTNTMRCVPFQYNGEGGNGNNFINQQACSTRCENDSFLYTSLQLGR